MLNFSLHHCVWVCFFCSCCFSSVDSMKCSNVPFYQVHSILVRAYWKFYIFRKTQKLWLLRRRTNMNLSTTRKHECRTAYNPFFVVHLFTLIYLQRYKECFNVFSHTKKHRELHIKLIFSLRTVSLKLSSFVRSNSNEE